MLKLLLDVTQELGFPSKPESFPKKQDLETGLQLYAQLNYCSWESKMAVGFLGRLLAEGNLGSLLLATINTIQGDATREAAVWSGFRNFYPVLEKELGLQYGKILLAIASPEELQAILAKDWPYLDSHREAVDACLQDHDCAGISNATKGLTASQASVLFSPSLVGYNEDKPPFSLIPFCAYQGHLDTLGEKVPNFPSFSVCSKFSPTIVEGTLCHTIAPTGHKTKNGEQFGALFVLDSNPVIPDPQLLQNQMSSGDDKDSIMLDKLASRNEAEVYIPTLSRFRGSGQGHFSLTGLKMITATRKFLERRGSAGSCSLQSYDDCHQENFLERLEVECGCIPFSLSLGLPHKVKLCSESLSTAVLAGREFLYTGRFQVLH